MDKKKSGIKKLAEMNLSNINILVVEDNAFNSEILCTILEKAGITVACAFDGLEAVEVFKNSEVGYFDLIFMDIQMPHMNGIDASIEIRRSDRADAKAVPIIAVTANAFTSDVEETKEAGMNGHIAKPVDFTILAEVLEQWVIKHE